MWSTFKHHRILFLLLVVLTAMHTPRTIHAQAETQPFFHLEQMDDSEFPLVQLQLRGHPTVLLNMDGAGPFGIEENGSVLPVNEYKTEQTGLQVGFLFDPVMLGQTAYSGQTYAADITYALYEMMGKDTFQRNQDELASFTMQPDGNQVTIQGWTGEPNLIYNAFYEQPPLALNADLLPTDAWMNVLSQFEGATGQPSSAKALILFWVGSQNIPTEFMNAALASNIQIHVVDMASMAPNEDRASILAALQETGGTYLAYQSTADLQELYQKLASNRTLYRLSYLSAQPQVSPVTVSATLVDGTVSQFVAAPLNEAGVQIGEPSEEQPGSESLLTAALESAGVAIREPTAIPLEEPVSSVQNSNTQSSSTQAASTQSSSTQSNSTQAASTQNSATAMVQDGADSSASGQGEAAVADGSAANSAGGQQLLSQNSPATGAANMITIPILNIDVPRLALQIALPLLLLLIGYVFYTERRDRRRAGNAAMVGMSDGQAMPYDPSNSGQQWPAPRMPALDGSTSAPVHDPYSSFLPQAQAPSAGGAAYPQPGPALQPNQPGGPVTPSQQAALQPAKVAAEPTTETPMPAVADFSGQDGSIVGRPNSIYVQQPGDEEATISISPLNNDEATYRLTDEVVTPIVGHLMRVTSDPKLPQMLPIHRLSSSVGTQHQLYIGRHSQKNTIVINDKRISREHAMIVQKDGQLYLRDNGSTSGTFLNWKQLRAGDELILRHSDLISLGDIVYEFRLQGEDEATVPTR